MRKKVLIAFGMVLLSVIFIGYGFTKKVEVQREYKAAMSEGITAVQAKHYQKAKLDFRNAAQHKQEDPQAMRNLHQLKLYLHAQQTVQQQDYGQAQQQFVQVVQIKHGLPILVRRSQAYIKEIQAVPQNNKDFESIYEQAVAANEDGQYWLSNHLLVRVLNDHLIYKCYYRDAYQKILTLKDANDRGLPLRVWIEDYQK